MHTFLLMLMFAALSRAAELVIDIPLDTLTFTIERQGAYDRIRMPAPLLQNPSCPELPTITYSFLLEKGKRISRVRVIHEQWETLEGTYYLFPLQRSTPLNEIPSFIHEDAAVYGDSAPYPADALIDFTSGNMRGYHIGQIRLCPFRFMPGQRELAVLKDIKLSVESTVYEDFVQPIRQSGTAGATVKRMIAQIVGDRDALVTAGSRGIAMDYQENGLVSDLPSLIGAPVDLVIITTESLQDACTEYARARSIRGYNSVVKTVPWIRQQYAGVDDAERLRNFLKDAVEKWGVLYVLLAGEVPDFPLRWVQMNPIYDIWPVHIVTDLYFSDLDGTWNDDGDFLFGEVEDSLDLFPDVFVGRLPVTDSDDVYHYLDKLMTYENPVDTTLQTRAMFFTSDFETSGDAYDMAVRLANRLPAGFQTSILNERPLVEVVDSLEAGFGLVGGLGHGDINNIRVRNSPRENANNFVFDSLMHSGKYACMFVITCYTNTFQSNSLSKHWITNPHGGGIAYIGPSGFSEAWLHEEYMNVQLDSLFSYPLAAVLGRSKIPFVADAQWNNWYRFYQFAINQLGDPTVTIWGGTPHTLESVTVDPGSMQVGTDTLLLTIEPAVSAPCLFYKDGETFILDTITGGVLQREIETRSSGFLLYSIMPEGYIPVTDSICVQPVDPHLITGSITVDDSAGNGDGVINAGENILLYISLHNTGGLTVDSANMQLVCTDTLIEMQIDTASFPGILPGDSACNATPFSVRVSQLMPDQHSFMFECLIDYHNMTGCDSFQLIGQACDLAYFTHEYSLHGSRAAITPSLLNRGTIVADSVTCSIAALDDSVSIIDSTVQFASIPPFTVISSAPDTFCLRRNYPNSALKFLLRIVSDGIEVDSYHITLSDPPAPDSIWSRGTENSIIIEWMPVSGAVGYHIFRASAPAEPYDLAYPGMVEGAYLEDNTASPGHHYYYYVRAVDSCLNHSSTSDTVTGCVNPPHAPGWPRVVYDYLFSSPNFGDLDPLYPGLEIVVCGKEGNVYAWHADGSAVTGDGRIFVTTPAEVWSSPALGDVDDDGLLDIVFGVRRTTDNLYALDNQGSCLPGWPISVPGSILSSPVLADIDSDGDLEIFVWTLYADVYAFHHDGTGVYGADGLLKNLPGIAFGTPAIGDIDDDGNLEICCAGGSGGDSLYVWKGDGNDHPGFPLFLQPRNLRYSVVLGNVLGDDRLELALYADSTELVYLVGPDAQVIWSHHIPRLADVEGSPIIADITGDGKGEIICGYMNGLTVLDSLGNVCPGFPDLSHDAKLAIAADVDSTGGVDIVSGSTDWHLYAYSGSGVQATGFPILLGSRVESCPAVYDIDNDGMLELMVGGNDYQFNVFDLKSTRFTWPRFRFDPYNTGTYNSPFLPGIETRNNDVEAMRFRLTAEPSITRNTATIVVEHANAAGQTAHDDDAEDLRLSIYDVTGRCVKTIPCDKTRPSQRIVWQGDDVRGREVAAGIYFIRMSHGHKRTACKLILLR